ncbi:MAG: PAS domain S-box protein [Hyphomicrobiaceae bacterium]
MANELMAGEIRPQWLGRVYATVEPLLAMRAWPIWAHLVLFAAALLAPILIFTFLLAQHLTGYEQRARETQLLSIARSLAADVDREISGVISTLKALSNSPSLQDGNLEAFYQQAKLTLAPAKRNAVLMDISGRQLVNTRLAWGDVLPYTQRDNTQFAQMVAQSRQLNVSDLFVGTVSKEHLVSVSVPVFRGDEVAYVLVLSISTSDFLSILRQSQLPRDWFAAISDRKGILIARSTAHEELVGKRISGPSLNSTGQKEGILRSVDLQGRPSLQAFHWSEVSGWRFATWAPLSVIEAPFRNLSLWLVGLGAGSLALATLLALYFGTRLSAPIAAAAAAGRLLGQGRVLKPLASSLQEANEVVDALRATSVEIRQRTREVKNSDTRLRMAQNLAGLATFEWNLRTQQIVCSENFRGLFGLSETVPLTPASIRSVIHPDDLARTDAEIDRVRASGGTYDLEFRIVSPARDVRWIAATGEAMLDQEDTPLRLIGANYDVTEFKNAAETNAQLAAVIQSSQDAVMSMGVDGVFRTWNPGAEALFGYRADEIIGKPIQTLYPEGGQEEYESIYLGLREGQRLRSDVVRRHKDGRLIDVNINVSPMYGPGGSLSGFSSIVRDISERKEQEAHLRLVMRELSHRSKNLLAVIQAMARQTARSSSDLEEFEKNYSQRLQALSASQDLIVHQNWHGAPLAELLRSILVPFVDEVEARIDLHGPILNVTPTAAQNLALSIHELATNASKYGALSVPAGRVSLTWSVVRGDKGEDRIRIAWAEKGGPPVKEPPRKGFGHIVIKKMIAQALDADVDLVFAPEGVTWTLHMPASFIAK